MAGQGAALCSRRWTEVGGPGGSGSSTNDRDKHGRQRVHGGAEARTAQLVYTQLVSRGI